MATAVIINSKSHIVSSIAPTNYSFSTITDTQRSVRINDLLPFRVRFSAVTIPGYGPNNPAPIGIAVIGFNNYIL